jgi:hypothetical protein
VGDLAYVADTQGGLFIVTRARRVYLPAVMR